MTSCFEELEFIFLTGPTFRQSHVDKESYHFFVIGKIKFKTFYSDHFVLNNELYLTVSSTGRIILFFFQHMICRIKALQSSFGPK